MQKCTEDTASWEAVVVAAVSMHTDIGSTYFWTVFHS
jgi:hypothetical protein